MASLGPKTDKEGLISGFLVSAFTLAFPAPIVFPLCFVSPVTSILAFLPPSLVSLVPFVVLGFCPDAQDLQ